MMQAIALSKAPVIASHSAARALANHSRNMDDEQLLALKKNGGVIQTVAFDGYVKIKPPDSPERAAAIAKLRGARDWGCRAAPAEPDRRARAPSSARRMAELDKQFPPPPMATVTDFVDHIDYLVKLIGIDHVGISSDFDGGGGVDGLERRRRDVQRHARARAARLHRGADRQDLERQPAARDGRGREGRRGHPGRPQVDVRSSAGCRLPSLCLLPYAFCLPRFLCRLCRHEATLRGGLPPRLRQRRRRRSSRPHRHRRRRCPRDRCRCSAAPPSPPTRCRSSTSTTTFPARGTSSGTSPRAPSARPAPSPAPRSTRRSDGTTYEAETKAEGPAGAFTIKERTGVRQGRQDHHQAGDRQPRLLVFLEGHRGRRPRRDLQHPLHQRPLRRAGTRRSS